jgi:hypothetical protein
MDNEMMMMQKEGTTQKQGGYSRLLSFKEYKTYIQDIPVAVC